MKVRVNGPALSDGEGGRYPSGAVIDIDDDLARQWLRFGFVEKAPRNAKARKATAPAPSAPADAVIGNATVTVVPSSTDAGTPGADDGSAGDDGPDADGGSDAGDVDSPGLVSTGGGWYTLPNGDRVRGKEAAEAAMEALGS